MYPNLKLQLFRMGIRQNRLAQLLGMDATVLSKIINGFREPTQSVRENIAYLLRTDVGWLFERTEPMADSENHTVANGADSHPPDGTLSAKHRS